MIEKPDRLAAMRKNGNAEASCIERFRTNVE